MESCVDSGQGRLPVLSVRELYFSFSSTCQHSSSYWVLAVGWFLLYCFVNDHSLELCLKIYKVGLVATLVVGLPESLCHTDTRRPRHVEPVGF